MNSVAARLSKLFMAAIVTGLVACGGGAASQDNDTNKDDDTQKPACGSPGRAGTSKCSAKTCNAGQYCDDTGFPTCTPGCTSDDNCSENEYCARGSGAAIGVCTRCGDTGGEPACERNTFYDKGCPSELPDAYKCASNAEPAFAQCEHPEHGLSSVWCCP